jgi:signal transduction histidine kinase
VGVTSTETGPAWERLSPRNWPLLWKLVAVGLVPALLAIVLGVLRVSEQAQTASELGTANRMLELRGRVADTADALRVERDRAALFVAEQRLGDRTPAQEAAARTDAAWEQTRTGFADTTDLDPTAGTALQEAEGGFAQLSVLRADVGGTAPVTAAQVAQRYTAIIGRTDVLARSLLRQLTNPEVIGLADALNAADAASEALARQHTVLGSALRAGEVTTDDRASVSATDSAMANGYSDYLLALPQSQPRVNFLSSPANAQRDTVKAAILDASSPGPIPVTPQAWDDAVAQSDALLDQAESEARTALTAAGDAAEERASNLAGVNSVILMLGLLLAVTIGVLMVRSLTRSLRVLRTSALDVAQRRLPQAVENMRAGAVPDVTVEPVPLHARDEVGQVARAFDTVHGQALKLAADQAALQSNVSSMFVNLSRRSQALVERQLQLIEQPESNEQDPDQLSNLFQLDHLATRMRRNSENLLVLAGTDLAKRNVAPVPLVDVLRAAVSEIEQYQRIVVQAPPQATVVGRATSDVIHLLAELLDNATNFSPPESQVVMSSMRAQDGSIVVEIADSGVGMVDGELADANRRLATPSAVDVSASRRMGLFVVGRLGARHGISVHLGGAPMGGPGGGVTASVTLPAHLVTVSGGDAAEPGPAPRALPTGAPSTTGSTANGVPPQRAGTPMRPLPRATLAVPPDGLPERLTGLNGLPTRTPGSSLIRSPAPAPEPGAESPNGGDPAVGPTTDEQPRIPAAEPTREGDGDMPDSDTTPTEAVPIASAGPTGDDTSDDTSNAASDDTSNAASDGTHGAPGGTAAPAAGSPAGHLADLQRARAAAFARRTAAGSTAGPRDADPDDTARPDSLPADAPKAEAERLAPDDREPAAEAPASPADREPTSTTDAPEPAMPAEAADVAARADTETADTKAADTGTVPDDDAPEEAADESSRPAERDTRPRPSPRPPVPTGPVPAGPNGTYRDLTVPSAPYEARLPHGQNGGSNGVGVQPAAAQVPEPQAGPHTTPLPVVTGSTPVPGLDDARMSATDAADALFGALTSPAGDGLFTASVPAIAEPDGAARSRRPQNESRRDPVDLTETTPIFAEIASAWFADDRPVPVDWELGERSDDDLVPASATVPPAASARTGLLDVPERPVSVPATDPAGQAFATAADEGWRAASGIAAERPDELTAAGLPKRRPRARLVPGSAGSAVLAAPASPTRSAESVRGRLASYQQGVRQGREIRLRRDPGRTGSQPVTSGDDTVASGSDGYDEETR